MIQVFNLETGEVLAEFDSWCLAKRMVSRINRSCGRRVVRSREVA